MVDRLTIDSRERQVPVTFLWRDRRLLPTDFGERIERIDELESAPQQPNRNGFLCLSSAQSVPEIRWQRADTVSHNAEVGQGYNVTGTSRLRGVG